MVSKFDCFDVELNFSGKYSMLQNRKIYNSNDESFGKNQEEKNKNKKYEV